MLPLTPQTVYVPVGADEMTEESFENYFMIRREFSGSKTVIWIEKKEGMILMSGAEFETFISELYDGVKKSRDKERFLSKILTH